MNITFKNSFIVLLFGISLLNGMQQEPPRKSPKMALSFILNQPEVTQPATVHPIQHFCMCPLCYRPFTRHLDLERHAAIKHHLWICPDPECRFKTIFPIGLVGHLLNIHDQQLFENYLRHNSNILLRAGVSQHHRYHKCRMTTAPACYYAQPTLTFIEYKPEKQKVVSPHKK